MVEHNLAKVGVVGSNPISRSFICPDGGIGRHAGLKILWTLKSVWVQVPLRVLIMICSFSLITKSSKKNVGNNAKSHNLTQVNELNKLFNDLSKINNIQDGDILEKKIWAVWNKHPNQNFLTESKPEKSGSVSTLAKNIANVSWVQIKQHVARTKPFFEHYLEKCEVPVFSEKEIHLSFSDQFTFNLVETPENIQFLKETLKTVSGREMDIKLILDTSNQGPDLPIKEKKKFIGPETGIQKSESEIIQDALDIFGGIVIK